MLNTRIKNLLVRRCQFGQYIDKKNFTSDGGEQKFFQLSKDKSKFIWAID
jgi:hypothetical protein